jgi:hypothetical protein
MRYAGFSRRHLLGTLGAAGAARMLPFLPAGARAAEPPKRLLLVFSPMGYYDPSFWPTRRSDTDFTLGETMTALADYQKKLIYPDGLLMYGAEWYFPDDDNEHASGAAMCFTGSKKAGFADGPSIEQPIADAIMAKNPALPYRTLALGVRAPSPSGHTAVFMGAGKKPVNADNSPRAVFDRLFKNFTPGQPTVDAGALMRRRQQKQSVLDLVKGDLGRLCTRVGADEKDKCDAHADAVRSIEKRLDLALQQSATPTGCTKPTLGATGSLQGDIDVQMDLITSAFTCDLTRVATLQLGFCDGGLDILGLNQHDVTHKVGDTNQAPMWVESHKRIDRWFADRWAYLFKKMDAVREPIGTLLDNTLIVFSSDTTTRKGAHEHTRFPYWMAGGNNFAFRTGRHLVYSNPGTTGTKNAKLWQASNRLFVSIGRAFGLDINTFGSMDPATGPLPML